MYKVYTVLKIKPSLLIIIFRNPFSITFCALGFRHKFFSISSLPWSKAQHLFRFKTSEPNK